MGLKLWGQQKNLFERQFGGINQNHFLPISPSNSHLGNYPIDKLTHMLKDIRTSTLIESFFLQ